MQRVAIIAGIEPGTPIVMVRLNPANDQWVEVDDDTDLIAIPSGDREALWDFAVCPFGCPTSRTGKAGGADPALIEEPCLVMACADENGPVGPVLVTPNDVSEALYDALQPDAAKTPAAFGATSVESFEGRMHYFGTSESATAYPQRHRWSAVGTAEPDQTIIGSGYLDVVEFQDRALQIKTIGNKLALYFGDGVAFELPTGLYTDAYRPQVVSRSRALLGTHALCAISPHQHFGIFNDGWWFLDSSGRWSEVGTLTKEESRGKAHRLSKWKEWFYSDLNMDKKHRIVVKYDRFRDLVRIAYTPQGADNDNVRVLNYHIPTDSCWPDRYRTPVTVWGTFDQQVEDGMTWDDYTALGTTWNDILAESTSWDDVLPSYIDDQIVHGDTGGLIFIKNNKISTQDGVPATWYYRSHEQSRSENPLQHQVFRRFGIEYMSLGVDSCNVLISSGEFVNFQSQAIDMNEGLYGSVNNSYAHFQLGGNAHQFYLSGTAPVAIRSLAPELVLHGHDDREGQT
jgi:hypothetical protein